MKIECALPAILLLLLGSTVQIIDPSAHAQASDVFAEAQAQLTSALDILDRARRLGATYDEIKYVGEQLSQAANLLQEARCLQTIGRTEESKALADRSLSISQTMRALSEGVLQRAAERSLRTTILIWGAVPPASILTALLVTAVYEWYVGRAERVLLRMTIRVRREEDA